MTTCTGATYRAQVSPAQGSFANSTACPARHELENDHTVTSVTGR
jgi:hypothetical protein